MFLKKILQIYTNRTNEKLQNRCTENFLQVYMDTEHFELKLWMI